METIAQRLKKIRDDKHLTQQEFGEILCVKKQAIANIECGHNNPSIELIGKLIENCNVNSNWLITGKGEMFNEQQPSVSNEELEQKVVEVMKKYGIIEK